MHIYIYIFILACKFTKFILLKIEADTKLFVIINVFKHVSNRNVS